MVTEVSDFVCSFQKAEMQGLGFLKGCEGNLPKLLL